MESIEFFQVFITIIILIMTLFYVYFRSLTSASSSSPSSVAAVDTDIPPLQEKYDVFISFRGEDTRDGFTSYLHKALLGKKIETYMDYKLEKGDDIGPALLEAIKKSKIALVIFSKDYASSTWCLKELVHILGCKKSHGQIVIPIFYRIDPSDLRNQQGTYALALDELEKRFKASRDEVVNWRDALKEAANMSGFHYSRKTGTEADFVEKVVQDVLTKLNRESSSDLRGLVGIEKKIEFIESLLWLDSPGVCCVGIWGMGGIGKTTLADAVFHRLSSKFEASCFLKNVRENSEERDGIYHLRNKLLCEILKEKDLNIQTPSISPIIRHRLSRTKALIVLDDVNASSQLEVLVGDHDRFVDGSVIIITARDKGLLEEKVDRIYEVEALRFNEALQLFHWHAFKNKSPTTDYTELSIEVAKYVKGIPLALKVMGSSFLRCKSKQEWEDQWNKLKRFPSEEIKKVLRLSYNGLEENEKEIFLDIACFHKGDNMNDVKVLLDSRRFCGEVGIKVLIDRSLISISKRNSIEMHDLVQEMGRAIVREQCIEEPGRRNRLFSAEDVYQVLTNNQITATVPAISFNWSKIEKLHLNHATFEKMCQLRWLRVGHSKFSERSTVMDSLDLPNSLSYLHWHEYPLKSLPSKFSPVNLVELHLPSSQVGAQLWTEDQNLINLKVISLCSSFHLTEVPNLSRSLKIERIDLGCCLSLVEIPSYFQDLDNLTYLGLGQCINIKTLPEMPRNVKFLDLSDTSIKELPSSVWSHKKISDFNISYCRDLEKLPSSSCNLNVSGTFSLHGCQSLREFSELPMYTRVLDLSETAIKVLPSSIECLFGLTEINLSSCKSLYFPEVLEPMEHLKLLILSCTSIKELPSSIGNLIRLQGLDLHECKKLEVVPNVIYNLSTLQFLNFDGCSKLKKLPPVSVDSVGLLSLEDLYLRKCSILEIPDGLVCLTSLRGLNMRETKIKSIPASIKQAAQLSRLRLIDCKSVESLPELPPFLQRLEAQGCTSLKTVSSSSSTALAQRWDEYIFFPGRHEIHNFSSCPKLDQNSQSNIMANAQLSIMRMATASSKFKEEQIELARFLEDLDDSYNDTDSEDEFDREDMIQEDFGRSSIFITCSGYEIPNWFSHQSEGSSIKIELRPDWFSTDFLGFALSLVIALNTEDAKWEMEFGCRYNFKTSNGESHEINHSLYNPCSHGSTLEDSHEVLVWWYDIFEVEGGARRPPAFYKLVTEASFEFYDIQEFNSEEDEVFEEFCSDYKVEKCGICPLYAQDVEIIKQRVCSSSS
ncbi:TMV resistance protein N-like isoform X2 [Prunus avium]|uniref:ADP-ribosyl cyclase/cyclic ADP-ribose hydrolase n=1 Tax=Prunus avium TaxID=42229 RepID=A0A6P5SQX2_PRUAV|nr:TMV resistance protein N-like isoform X2 [Prunus avium]